MSEAWAGWPDRPVTGGAGAAGALAVHPGHPLTGIVRVPGDKSVSHRALLLAAKATGTSVVSGLSDGDDVRRTALAVRSLGAELVVASDGAVHITGGVNRLHESAEPLDVGNSGTAMRLLAGFVAPYPWFTVLVGDDSVSTRPMDRVVDPLRRMGAIIDGRERGRLAPLAVRGGQLSGIDLRMPVASAQVKSAVLLAGLGASTPTIVREPAPTRAHTEEMLIACGAELNVSEEGRTVRVSASVLKPFELTVPGDPSQAAFWVVAGCIVPGSDVTVERVYVGRARDGFVQVLQRMGAQVEVTRRDGTTADIRARYGPLRGTTIAGDEVAGLIDEIPVLAVAAAVAEGPTTIRDAAELAVKETNRITTITSELGALGARIEARHDGLVIAGGSHLQGATVQSHGDHRIAMAMAVAAMSAEGSTSVEGWGAVATSYPDFAGQLARLSP
jgi:3-phosphoshikimate 1-carboxyvinyltransferase